MITTVVGNYPKVAEGAYSTKLIGTITRWQRKELTDDQLEQTCREITRAVIKEQEQAGIDLLTDGQIRWEDLVTPMARGIEGFEINGLSRWYNNNTYYRRPILHKKPVRRGPILVEQYRFAAGCTQKPVKAVLPGPYTFAAVSEDRHFKKQRPLVMALAEMLNAEARDLAKAGAAFIQFDEPSIGFGKMSAAEIGLAKEALNAAVKGVPATTAVYTYFGALNGAFDALQKSAVQVIGVDVVSDPSALARLKRAKIAKPLAVGCLDARNTKLESVRDLHAMFAAVSKRVPADQLYVNPSCGLEFLPHTQALAKLTRLAEAARSFATKTRRAS
jgi:5-methyltetrahydropteroyltriglutamate--homocysteine methyltransferase